MTTMRAVTASILGASGAWRQRHASPQIPAIAPCEMTLAAAERVSRRTASIRCSAMDIRIGVTHSPRELNLELADDTDRDELRKQVEAALTGAVDILWLTDQKAA